MPEKIRWGILGTGAIARSFAADLRLLPDAALVAVGSRARETAERFGAEFGAARCYGSYAELARDPAVEVIYVATPHNLHCENTLMCLEAGKAVLCEKPFAINAAEAGRMIQCARAHGLFLMEAMWMRYLPAIVKLRDLLAAGVIGEVRFIEADFGFHADFDPERRLFNPALGGGTLLDIGIYPLSLAFMVLGAPSRIVSMAHLGQTGVDEQAALVLGYPQGQLALLSSSFNVDMPIEAVIMGTEGSIKLHKLFFRTQRLTVFRRGLSDAQVSRLPHFLKRLGRTSVLRPLRERLRRPAGQELSLPFSGNGYQYQAIEVMRCLRADERESPVMPLDETFTIMRTMDEIRAQWGLRYPGE